jgi:hypothetical protein
MSRTLNFEKIHCFLILRGIPRWGDLWENKKKKAMTPMKHKEIVS